MVRCTIIKGFVRIKLKKFESKGEGGISKFPVSLSSFTRFEGYLLNFSSNRGIFVFSNQLCQRCCRHVNNQGREYCTHLYPLFPQMAQILIRSETRPQKVLVHVKLGPHLML
ncbi:hypothetical protein L1987_03556 [Smallanthus sonchifolius]|uniref:Uncharacterized protein n=1 Tax=Smallanthus sonchifolius TaxID=185202 RepID=A0ACB9KAZ8_9ASTR|nr:hypothetical protein L1987_03556 [Smallanthus sonchifolius]